MREHAVIPLSQSVANPAAAPDNESALPIVDKNRTRRAPDQRSDPISLVPRDRGLERHLDRREESSKACMLHWAFFVPQIACDIVRCHYLHGHVSYTDREVALSVW